MQTGQPQKVRYLAGITSLKDEVDIDSLPVQGHFPDWLQGSLLRNGPALFEIGKRRFMHFFDGMAMLHRYTFRNGVVSYRNRFQRTDAYIKAVTKGKLPDSFGTKGKDNLLKRWFDLAKLMVAGDNRGTYNTSVSIVKLGEEYLALTELPTPTVFDPVTLKVLGEFHYDDGLVGQVSSPHPLWDYDKGYLYNFVTGFGLKSKYQIYRIKPGSHSRKLLCSIPVDEPGYMHSFGMSENYIILAEFPIVVQPLKILIGSKSYIENFEWKPERGTRFFVVNKYTGKLEGIFRSKAFFAYHHINAFEQGGDIFIDIGTAQIESLREGFLTQLEKGSFSGSWGLEQFRRYRVPLSAGSDGNRWVDFEVMVDERLDLPELYRNRYGAKLYRYAYGVSTNRQEPEAVSNQLIKVDTNNRTALFWREEGCYPGEPIFVPKPGSQAEDEGVILSVVLDGNRSKSFLLALESGNFEEIGRAFLPHHIPLEFHGLFEQSLQPGSSG